MDFKMNQSFRKEQDLIKNWKKTIKKRFWVEVGITVGKSGIYEAAFQVMIIILLAF
jgi:hypothetical protein